MSDLVVVNSSVQKPEAPQTFEVLVEETKRTVAATSQKTYEQTYRLWEAWCKQEGVDPIDLYPATVTPFLIEQRVTKRTRQRYLSALRKMARMLAIDYTRPEYRARYEALKLIKTPTENLGGKERTRRALEPQDVWKVLSVWDGDELDRVRNKALLSIMFYTGMRRAEIAALKWTEVNLSAGTITVAHGKGDKYREVAIVGESALEAIKRWKVVQKAAAKGKRETVFCSISRGGLLGEDKPITPLAINHLIEKTVKLSGVEFTPHDARRTLGTDLLSHGNSTADVQAQLGHAHASTTIQGYGIGADARKRRARFNTSY